MKSLEDTGIEHTHIESLTGNIVVWAELGSESENDSEVPMNAEFGMHTDHLIVIDGNVINDKVFDEELVNYRLSYRPDRVDDLIRWISESEVEHTKTLMIADLITLLSWDDEFVWDNVSTNEFVSPTQNTEYFNAICKDVLKANQRQC
ncbi:hypothetical protein JL857_20825 [Vibrio parahaemolyticus]|uniref:Uncharacterized protein n=1 Tax=Vibrio parahaemolyticus TaxID=670 RepID=A0A9Q3UHX6_VIBPH|nr:hypothetical protein [Vibrio parahaemolyticus]MCC3807561.1 hypothetical protein [Vibrio parahaemolyticus]MCI9696450.1 hypothetical protein [Vibrio parahaemolyticus]MCI9711086.1 hypothetical protein [Vibrio parahaemolyticus]MCI9715966.1 hypothetical protein [Vibrio parahaemolyticus]